MNHLIFLAFLFQSSANAQIREVDTIITKKLLRDDVLRSIGDEGGHGGSSDELNWLSKAEYILKTINAHVTHMGLNVDQKSQIRLAVVETTVIADDERVKTLNSLNVQNQSVYTFSGKNSQAILFSPTLLANITNLEILNVVFKTYLTIAKVDHSLQVQLFSDLKRQLQSNENYVSIISSAHPASSFGISEYYQSSETAKIACNKKMSDLILKNQTTNIELKGKCIVRNDPKAETGLTYFYEIRVLQNR